MKARENTHGWRGGVIDDFFPTLYRQKFSQHVRACAELDGAICQSKNRKIVPYHRDSLNTRNFGRLLSLYRIMAAAIGQICAALNHQTVANENYHDSTKATPARRERG